MTNKKLYCEDVLQMLFVDSDSEGEYLPFGNDDRLSNDRASPGTSLLCNGAAGHGESVHEAQTSDHFEPLPNGDGGGSRVGYRFFFFDTGAKSILLKRYGCQKPIFIK